jgi:hypothetical protein
MTQAEDRAFLSHFDRPIAFHRSFVTITQSVNAALMLSQLVYWTLRKEPDEWIYKTRDEWTEETGLTRREQENARRVLRDRELIEESLHGVPATMNFRVRLSALRKALSDGPKQAIQLARNVPTGRHETYQLDGTKAPNKLVRSAPGAKGTTQMVRKRPTNIRKTTQRLHKSLITPTPTPQVAQGSAPETPPAPKLTPRKQRIAQAMADFDVQVVMRMCSWTDENLAPVINTALEQYRRRENIPKADAGKLMVQHWMQYTADAQYLRYTYSPRNWIKQGHWDKPESWPIDRERLQSQQMASLGVH